MQKCIYSNKLIFPKISIHFFHYIVHYSHAIRHLGLDWTPFDVMQITFA